MLYVKLQSEQAQSVFSLNRDRGCQLRSDAGANSSNQEGEGGGWGQVNPLPIFVPRCMQIEISGIKMRQIKSAALTCLCARVNVFVHL